jgi:hypothetical protein
MVNLKYFSESSYWFLLSACGEGILGLLVIHYFCYRVKTKSYLGEVKLIPEGMNLYWRPRVLLILTGVLFLTNIWQYYAWEIGDYFSEYYISSPVYISINRMGFEVILATLWVRDNLWTSLQERLNIPNILLFWVLIIISVLSGNY